MKAITAAMALGFALAGVSQAGQVKSPEVALRKVDHPSIALTLTAGSQAKRCGAYFYSFRVPEVPGLHLYFQFAKKIWGGDEEINTRNAFRVTISDKPVPTIQRMTSPKGIIILLKISQKDFNAARSCLPSPR